MLPWVSDGAAAPSHAPVRLRWSRLDEPVLVALLAAPRELARHRFAGVGVLCSGASCALCLSGIRQDNRYYAPALIARYPLDKSLGVGAFERCVWELTPDQFVHWPKAHGAPVVILVERLGRANGPVRLSRAGVWKALPIPTAFPIDPVLERVYQRTAAGLEAAKGGAR